MRCCQHPSVAAQIEAQEFLGSCSCPQYMERAERRLHEEVERVDNYLDPSSEPKITRVVENELIQKQVLPRPALPQLLCAHFWLESAQACQPEIGCAETLMQCSCRASTCCVCTLCLLASLYRLQGSQQGQALPYSPLPAGAAPVAGFWSRVLR